MAMSDSQIMAALRQWANSYDPTNPYDVTIANEIDRDSSDIFGNGKEGIDWEGGLDKLSKALGKQTGNSGGAKAAYAPSASLPGISYGGARSEVMPMQDFGSYDAPILMELLKWASRR